MLGGKVDEMADGSGQVAVELGAALLASEAEAILATDQNGIIRFWNPGAVRLFGSTPEQALGAPLDLIIPERLRQRHWTGWEQVIATGATRYGAGDLLSVPALAAGGRQVSVEFTITLLRGLDGGITGMAAILRDVTPRFEELSRLRRELAERSGTGQTRGTRP